MKFNKWTMGLAAVGVVSLASAARADETKMSQVQTALSNTTLSGYVDTSAMWQLGSQNGGAIPQYTPGSVKSDGFNLNAVDIALDKPMDESPWASGYHVELMYGPDAVPGGSGTSANIRQAYLALRTPIANSGIDWKVGVFDTPIGYESTTDGANPNYTRSYGYDMEPTTHTGILGTYKANDMLSVSAGIADSSNVAIGGNRGIAGPAGINGRAGYESQKTYMGAITLTAPDSFGWAKGATLNLGVINALDKHTAPTTANAGTTLDIINNTGTISYHPLPYVIVPGDVVLGTTTVGAVAAAAGTDPTTSLYAGLTVPTPLTALKFGAAFDYLEVHNRTAVKSDDSLWNVGLYANYQANDNLSFNVRGEHMAFGRGDNASDEATFTAQYLLWGKSVISRMELRWDHAEHGTAFDQNTTGGVNHENAYLLALNLIYQF
jgi:hypothetical protein